MAAYLEKCQKKRTKSNNLENYHLVLQTSSIISIFLFANWSNNEAGGWEVRPVCTPSWTFAHSNHTAIMAISATPYLVLVQLPGAICKAAEQEMRLVCPSLEDVLEGATLKSAR